MEKEKGVNKKDNKARDVIIARKLRFSENPSSIVIAPKTREGHILAKMIFGLDRAVSGVRIMAAAQIPIQDAIAGLKKVSDYIAFFKEVMSMLGDGGMGFYGQYNEDLETKKMLAKKFTSYIILPRSNEAREISLLLKKFDPLLLQFRNTCADFSKSEDVFRKTAELIIRLDSIARELSSLAQSNYRSPKGMEALANYGVPSLQVAVPLEGVMARKEKRIGGIA